MRTLRAAQLALTLLHAGCRQAHGSGPKARSEVLARWNAEVPTEATSKATDASTATSSSSRGKGMSFASGLFGSGAATSTRVAASETTVADVKWDLCERMDFYVQFAVPATWTVAEAVRENSVSIQCSPPPPSPPPCAADAKSDRARKETGGSSVHGISINCFAYKQRVAQPDTGKLLHIFLKRFNASVGNSLEVISEHVGKSTSDVKRSSSPGGEMDHDNISEMLATRLNSAVAEITFTPGAGQPLAHGLCRAFFNSNCRFHYVVVVAVPEDEYGESQDLMINTLMSVVESRVEAAAKQT